MDHPEVAVPLAEPPAFRARYEFGRLLQDLAAVLASDDRSAEPPPPPADRARLGVGTAARLCDLVAAAESRDDVWAWVSDVGEQEQTHAEATRRWINRRLLPLLDAPDAPHAANAVAVVREVTGLAFDPVLARR